MISEMKDGNEDRQLAYKPLCLIAAADDDGRRLDRILRKTLGKLPLSAIHRLLREGAVLVDGKAATAAYRIHEGQIINVYTLDSAGFEKTTAQTPSLKTRINQNFPDILYEGEGLLVINKPAGFPVHAGKGNINRPSLETLVRSYLSEKIPSSLSFKPGPLHRLDMPSSGVLVFSASLNGARLFSTLMRERKIRKFYLSLIEGKIENTEVWQDELKHDSASKNALTKVSPIINNQECTLILAEIVTGRKHQIRIQAASRGYPLQGDRKYGAKNTEKPFFLHAWRLELPPPFPSLIEAPLPDNFKITINKLFGDKAIHILSKT